MPERRGRTAGKVEWEDVLEELRKRRHVSAPIHAALTRWDEGHGVSLPRLMMTLLEDLDDERRRFQEVAAASVAAGGPTLEQTAAAAVELAERTAGLGIVGWSVPTNHLIPICVEALRQFAQPVQQSGSTKWSVRGGTVEFFSDDGPAFEWYAKNVAARVRWPR